MEGCAAHSKSRVDCPNRVKTKHANAGKLVAARDVPRLGKRDFNHPHVEYLGHSLDLRLSEASTMGRRTMEWPTLM